jgi:histidinol-phosphatase
VILTDTPRKLSATPRLADREIRATLPRLFAAMKDSDAIILRHFRRARIDHKADGSEVTIADRGAERVLRRRLAASWPRDRILGEEYGGELVRRGRCWLVDPIDGTASYVLGVPMFGTLISLLIDGEPVLGCIHLSALAETTYAATGFGCWLSRPALRPRRVHVGPARTLSQAQVGLSSLKQSDLLPHPGPLRLSKLLRKAGRLRLVGDCVQYALVCRGVIDAAVDPLMNPWDIGPLAVCIREAGGSVSDLRGRTTRIVEHRSFVAASTETLRRAICREVTGQDPSKRKDKQA